LVGLSWIILGVAQIWQRLLNMPQRAMLRT